MGLTTYLLSQTARIAKTDLDDALAGQGLRPRHLAMLAALSDSGPCSQLTLSRQLALDPSDVTGAVDDLVERGYAERRVDPHDRRRRVVRLTGTGRRCLTRLMRLADQVAARLLAPIPEQRRSALHRDLLLVLTTHDAQATRASPR